jgi:hypothetical protein
VESEKLEGEAFILFGRRGRLIATEYKSECVGETFYSYGRPPEPSDDESQDTFS